MPRIFMTFGSNDEKTRDTCESCKIGEVRGFPKINLFFSQPWALPGNKWGIFSLQVIGPTRGSITNGKEIDQR